jgi:SAM-dependent methyltransferase
MSLIETKEARAKRRARRLTFDTIASEYHEARAAYPPETAAWIVERAALAPGAPVLEIGCGPGEFTKDLITHRLRVTAIDPGPALIERAAASLGSAAIFVVSTFEDFDAPPGSFDLVVSASAFHWVDPEVRWSKPAALLRQGGWLAIVDTINRYDADLQTALWKLWIDHSEDGGAWATEPSPTMEAQLRASSLFDEPVVDEHLRTVTVTSDEVLALARTSGAFLSYTPDRQRSFVAGLASAIKTPSVQVVRGCSLLMAQLR